MTIPEFRLECLRIIVCATKHSYTSYQLICEADALFKWIMKDQIPADGETKKYFDLIINKLDKMADKFDVLTTEVGDLGTVVDSAVTLLDSIADQIADAKDDPAQIQVIVDNLRAKKTSLAEAVAKNTAASTETPAE